MELAYNGYRNAVGGDVVNGQLFKRLHEMIGELESLRMSVSFWLVGREWNTDADQLANEALEDLERLGIT
jgi:hypothetical protein